MDWQLIIQLVIAVISGGGLVSVLNYKLSSRKTDSDQFALLIEEYKEMRRQDLREISALKERVISLEKNDQEKHSEIYTLQTEIHRLQNQLLMFEGSHSDIPLPTWLKDTSGKMLFLNSEYERFFLIPQCKKTEDYVGKTDSEIWDDETSESFANHDKEVLTKRRPRRFIETMVINETRYFLDVLKYPRKLKNRVIGIGGIVLRRSTKLLWIDEQEQRGL